MTISGLYTHLANCTRRHCMAAILAVFAAALFPPAAAQAWNDVGHRLAALIAWELLDETARNEVVRILRQHERFQPDFAEQMPPDLAANGDDAAQWIFAQASIWPDFIRSFQGDLREQYHRSTWHYINQPIYLSDADRQHFGDSPPVNAELDLPANRENDDQLNIVQALKLTRMMLKDPAAPEREKALRLCWLFHLVGDLHQPMHSSALVSRVRFPTGDRGGNDVRLGMDNNLHRLWDDLPGTNQSFGHIARRAQRTLNSQRYRMLGESSRSGDFVGWLKESRELAESTAYHPSVIAAAHTAEQSGEAGPIDVRLPDSYIDDATPIARRRIVQAGYRLAMILQDVVQ